MLASAFLFGYFSIDPTKGFNYAGMIWSTVQVAYYLAIGSIQYFNGYNFMVDTYRTVLIRKTNILERFKNMFYEYPEQFKVKNIKNLNIKNLNTEIVKNSQKEDINPENNNEEVKENN